MNGMSQQPQNTQQQPNQLLADAWQRTYAVADRQRAVQFLVNSLRDMQGPTFDQHRATTVASEFEKYTFFKTGTKDEYLRLIRQKIAQLRANPRSQPAPASVPALQPDVNSTGMSFLQQQAQARQQLAAHIQSQMRVPPQGNLIANSAPSSAAASATEQNLTPLQHLHIQQVTNMIKTSPIPPSLLNKIPNLPPDVTTWSQIYECFKKRIIPELAMPMIKEIHQAHLLMAMRQQQNRQRMNRQQQPLNQGQSKLQAQQVLQQPLRLQPLPGMNMAVPISTAPGNNTPQILYNANGTMQTQNQQLLQRHMQQAQQQPRAAQGTQSPTQLYRQQQVPPQSQHLLPSGPSQNQPKFQVTAQDFIKYKADAMTLLLQLQANRSIQPNLDQNQKDNFIRKFIMHQKAQLWKQQQAQKQLHSSSTSPYGNTVVPQIVKPTLNAQMLNQQRIQQQQQHLSQEKANAAAGMTPQQQLNMSQKSGLNSQSLNQRPSSPNMDQSRTAAQGILPANISHGTYGASFAANQGLAQLSAPGMVLQTHPEAPPRTTSGTAPLYIPQLTDELRSKLRLLVQEASQNPVVLRDMTSLLSLQDKTVVQEMMTTLSQQYNDVDSIISYFYMLTRNEAGTRRLIQMKYMTKSIMEKLPRGVYLAESSLLEKLSIQYKKYFDYVKNQFALKKQQLLKQQQAASQVNVQGDQYSNAMSLNNAALAPLVTLQNQQSQPVRPGQNNAWPNGIAPTQRSLDFNTSSQGGLASSAIQSGALSNQQQGLHPQQMQQQLKMQQQQFQHHLNIQQQQQMLQQQQILANSCQNQVGSGGVPTILSTPTNTLDVVNTATRTLASQTRRAPVTNGRRKGSAKGLINVASIPTPAGSAPTPGAASAALKTPSSVLTPQVVGVSLGSSKNTPNENQSPLTLHNRLSLNRVISLAPNDVFADLQDDSQSARRRELLNNCPEKFFYAALANMLDLSDPLGSGVVHTPQNDKNHMNSPLSPDYERWTCEVKPMAIGAAFKQAAYVRQVIGDGVLEDFMPKVDDTIPSRKREFEEVSDDEGDVDLLFVEKKQKFEEFNMQGMLGYDDWKQFVVEAAQ